MYCLLRLCRHFLLHVFVDAPRPRPYSKHFLESGVEAGLFYGWHRLCFVLLYPPKAKELPNFFRDGGVGIWYPLPPIEKGEDCENHQHDEYWIFDEFFHFIFAFYVVVKGRILRFVCEV